MTEDDVIVPGGVYVVLISCTIALTIIAYIATQFQTNSPIGQLALIVSLIGVIATMVAAIALGFKKPKPRTTPG
jgi:ABC-type Na+ efflux pump permease subunit